MERLLKITSREDIPDMYRDTPVGLLIEYHNLGRKNDEYESAELLVAMCMDNRKRLFMPDNFAFIIRTGGANLQHSDFHISYAISIGRLKHVALIGHTQCGMVNIRERKEPFVRGLVEVAGWDKITAEDHFELSEPIYETGNEIEFTRAQTRRLRELYPGITIAPFIYRVEDNLLYLIKE